MDWVFSRLWNNRIAYIRKQNWLIACSYILFTFFILEKKIKMKDFNALIRSEYFKIPMPIRIILSVY